MYEVLADMVAIIHFIVIFELTMLGPVLFVLTIVGRIRTFFWVKVYLGLGLITGVCQAIFLGCPLTLIEETLRRQYDSEVDYFGSFTAHYAMEVFGIDVGNMAFAALVVIVILVSIVTFFLHKLTDARIEERLFGPS